MSKKQADERLQEIRNPAANKIRYRKRLQQDEEDEQYLQEELRRILDGDDSVSEIP